MSVAPLRVAVAGLGTVGTGVLRLLARHAAMLEARCGRALIVCGLCDPDRKRARGVDLSGFRWHDDAVTLGRQSNADVVVELIGGEGGVAYEVVHGALCEKRHVVTANKALLARHGAALGKAAREAGVALACEASVAGGVPVIKALREGLIGNRLTRIKGILNGTCNYILTSMASGRRGFAEVLAEAQALGYAEADPALDIGGADAAHKLAILSSLAWGGAVDLDGVSVRGITAIAPVDAASAATLGFCLRHVGEAELRDGGLFQEVHPCLVAKTSSLAHVDGVYNAVVLHGDFAGDIVLQGQGAGMEATASAVVADIADIARGAVMPFFGEGDDGVGKRGRALPPPRPFYVRLQVEDRPGVVAEVAGCFAAQGISIASLLQREQGSGTRAATLILTTHTAPRACVTRTLERLAALASVRETPQAMTILR